MRSRVTTTWVLALMALLGTTIALATPSSAVNTQVNCSASSVADINTCIANANAGANQDITLTLNNAMVADRDITPLVLPASSTMTIDGNAKLLDLNSHKGFDITLVMHHTITITNLFVKNGHTTTNGGAVYIQAGKLVASHLRLSDSSATFSVPSTGSGGALAIDDSDDTATISNSSFAGNSATGFGGAIYSLGTVILTNSTVYGNQASANGGLMVSGSNVADVSSIRFSTISGNTAGALGSNVGAFDSATQLELIGSVLADPLGGQGNCQAAVRSASYSVISSAGGNDTSCGSEAVQQLQFSTSAALGLGSFDATTTALRPADSSILVNYAPGALGTGISNDQNWAPRAGAFTAGAIQVAMPAAEPGLTATDFGTVTVGSNGGTTTTSVTNSGSAPLTFGAGAVTLGGADASQFAITADTCSNSVVGIANYCEVTFTFLPTSVGAKSATLDIADDALDSPQSVALSGTGVASGGGGSGGGGGGGSTTPTDQPAAQPTQAPAPAATVPTAAAPTQHVASAVLGFRKGTPRMSDLARGRLAALIGQIPAGATGITFDVTGYVPDGRRPARMRDAMNERAASVSSAIERTSPASTVSTRLKPATGDNADLAGKVDVVVHYTS